MRSLALLIVLFATQAYALDYAEAPYCLAKTNLRLQIADTPEKREHGLMDRKKIAPYDGMIFLLDAPRPVQMWMKNTPHSLDMLFIDEMGKLVHIARNTTPYSESVVTTETPVKAVIELEGGRAEKEGMAEGAILRTGACHTAAPLR